MPSANAHSLNEKAVPVTESLFNEILHAEPAEAIEVAKQLPLENRAKLASFCYSRRHLNHLGLLIASTCDRMALRRSFGTAGDVVFKQSRDVEKTLAAQKKSRSESTKITLATSANVVALRPAMMDFDESEAEAELEDAAS